MSIDGVLPERSSVGGKETWTQIKRARLRAYMGLGGSNDFDLFITCMRTCDVNVPNDFRPS
jgi:hypothetical protein